GGALLHGMNELLRETMKIPIVVADDPLTAVARGTGIILENLKLYKDVLVKNDDNLPQAK
ncbi:MAG: rod shape-determining protein, partial [Patescibacteria group bacterium]